MERETRPAENLKMFELVFPSDLNAHGTMFGGRVVALMDKCAGLCVGRWSRRTSVTASIDAIQFGIPIRQGQMVEIEARVAYVGNTSCVVRVEVHAQELERADRFFCCEGYFTMVCLDANGTPATLPLIPVTTEAERQEWETARAIKERLLARRRSVRPDGKV
ncbi:MAG TPA: acyl-CoA thioesterase [Firmicutes bacterium]|nr:acyl-CoA thioesterase [Bacillota bacterium]